MYELHPGRIRKQLHTSYFGSIAILFESVDSTNSSATRLASEGFPEGTTVISCEQSNGRGRKGRKWFSTSKGSLLFSIIVRPKRGGGGLTLLLAYSVAEALDDFISGCVIKWPNDIYFGRRKAGGILAEGTSGYAVIGAGLNVNIDREGFPAELAGISTSIEMESGKAMDRGAILCAILDSFEGKYGLWSERGLAPFRERILERMLYIDKEVIIEDNGSKTEGRFLGITDEGYLLLDSSDGLKSCYSGDLTLRSKDE